LPIDPEFYVGDGMLVLLWWAYLKLGHAYTKRPFDILKTEKALASFIYTQVTEYNTDGLFVGYYGADVTLTSESTIHTFVRIIGCRKLE
jgi:hypothetical protein